MKVDIAAGTVKYDARAAHACVETFSGVTSCTCTAIAAAQRSLLVLSCQGFTGTLRGGDCSTADDECVAGTGCGFTDTTFTQLVCKPLLPAGAACTTADTCVSPYACVTPDPLVNAGTCTAPPGLS